MTHDTGHDELIQQEIDGANSEAEGAALQAVLERDPAARQDLEQLRQLATTLETIEPLQPPPGLRQEILDKLRPRRSAMLLHRLFDSSAWAGAGLRYGYAVAAGVLIGAIGYHTVSGRFGPGELNGDDLVGTMGVARHEEPLALTQLEFDLAGAFGTARVVAADDGFEVWVSVDTPDPVEVVLNFDPGQIGFVGFRQPLADRASVLATEDEVRFVHPGRRPQIVRLEPRTSNPAGIALRFVRQGSVLYESSLELPGRGDRVLDAD